MRPSGEGSAGTSCARKSNGGAFGLCVPPSSVSRDGSRASSSAGSTACSTSVALPAVPTARRYSPPAHLRRLEAQRARAKLGAGDTRPAHLRRRVHGGQMLPQQPRLLPARADPVDAKRPAGDERERERGAQNLPAAFALGAVDGDPVGHLSSRAACPQGYLRQSLCSQSMRAPANCGETLLMLYL